MENQIQYPFTKCLHPKRIKNPYTNDWIYVNCGKCAACQCTRASRYNLQCELEAAASTFVLFATLTYAPEFVPLASLMRTCTVNSEGCYKEEIQFLDHETGEMILSDSDIEESAFELQQLFAKYGTQYTIRYLRKADLQLFLKRFRYHFNKYIVRQYELLYPNSCEEVKKGWKIPRVRYYACGEYGEQHFRPHYHILFYFNADTNWLKAKISEAAVYALSQAWKYGRTDIQHARGDVAQYVASYVSCNSKLPAILKVRAVSPFCVHSARLGQSLLKKDASKVYELPVREFIKRSIEIDGRVKEFSLWRSAYSFFFPKVRNYNNLTQYSIYWAYTIYGRLKAYFENLLGTELETTAQLSQEIVTFVSRFSNKQSIIRYFSTHNRIAGISESFEYLLQDYNLSSMSASLWDSLLRRIYCDLLISRHFQIDLSEGNKNRERYLLSKIKDFYKDLDSLHLSEFFESQQAYFAEDFATEEDLVYFYPELGSDSLCNNPLYGKYACKVAFLNKIRTKTKLQNDINNVFNLTY